jgi:hypothetical protein
LSKSHERTVEVDYDTVEAQIVTHVMPGLVPGIHAFPEPPQEVVDGRDESGHDAERMIA